MRHVDECSLCLKCHTTDTAPEATAESDKPWDGQPLPTPGSRRLLQHFDLSLSSSVSSLHSKYSEIDSMDGRTGGVGPLGEAGNKEEEEEEEHGPLGRALLQEKKKRKVKVPAYNPDTDPKVPVWFKPKSYMAPDPSARLHLPPCRECWGCRHNLTLLATNTTFLGNTYVNERGATSRWGCIGVCAGVHLRQRAGGNQQPRVCTGVDGCALTSMGGGQVAGRCA